MKAFISADTSLETKDILVQYTERWTIKVFFRQNKMDLGLDSYQIRSEKAIKRFWILAQLPYLYCTFGVCENHCKFGDGLKLARIQKTAMLIDWIYIQAKNGVAKENIINALRLSKNIKKAQPLNKTVILKEVEHNMHYYNAINKDNYASIKINRKTIRRINFLIYYLT